jgi:hypothetical protein
MTFATIENDDGNVTIVNTDQITYVRQDMYGIAIHFTSGEHVVCPLELDTLKARLFGEQPLEQSLILQSAPASGSH